MDKRDWHRPTEEMHGEQTSCPKCELEFRTMLTRFCTHHECPVRDWEQAQDKLKPPKPLASLEDRLRTEAARLGGKGLAALLREAADEIQRHNYR